MVGDMIVIIGRLRTRWGSPPPAAEYDVRVPVGSRTGANGDTNLIASEGPADYRDERARLAMTIMSPVHARRRRPRKKTRCQFVACRVSLERKENMQ